MTLSWKKTASLISIVTVLLMVPVVPVQSYSAAQTEVVRDYWPTDGWLNTTPEEQGMDSELLNEMMEQIGEHGLRIDSILITNVSRPIPSSITVKVATIEDWIAIAFT